MVDYKSWIKEIKKVYKKIQLNYFDFIMSIIYGI